MVVTVAYRRFGDHSNSVTRCFGLEHPSNMGFLTPKMLSSTRIFRGARVLADAALTVAKCVEYPSICQQQLFTGSSRIFACHFLWICWHKHFCWGLRKMVGAMVSRFAEQKKSWMMLLRCWTNPLGLYRRFRLACAWTTRFFSCCIPDSRRSPRWVSC